MGDFSFWTIDSYKLGKRNWFTQLKKRKVKQRQQQKYDWLNALNVNTITDYWKKIHSTIIFGICNRAFILYAHSFSPCPMIDNTYNYKWCKAIKEKSVLRKCILCRFQTKLNWLNQTKLNWMWIYVYDRSIDAKILLVLLFMLQLLLLLLFM